MAAFFQYETEAWSDGYLSPEEEQNLCQYVKYMLTFSTKKQATHYNTLLYVEQEAS